MVGLCDRRFRYVGIRVAGRAGCGASADDESDLGRDSGRGAGSEPGGWRMEFVAQDAILLARFSPPDDDTCGMMVAVWRSG